MKNWPILWKFHVHLDEIERAVAFRMILDLKMGEDDADTVTLRSGDGPRAVAIVRVRPREVGALDDSAQATHFRVAHCTNELHQSNTLHPADGYPSNFH